MNVNKNNTAVIQKTVLAVMSLLILAYVSQAEAKKLPEVVFGTDWFAQAYHGGYYQAVATGIYKKFGLDVKIDMGRPGINGQQLLAAGKYQFYMGSAIDNLVATAHGLPLVTVATIFQKSPICIFAHTWARKPKDLTKATEILVGANAIDTWWPWAITKFGYKPSQRVLYTGSVATFLEDKNIAEQGYIGTKEYTLDKFGTKYKAFLLADYGYPNYSETIETTKEMIRYHSDIVKKFIEATMLGWKSYLANPAPGNKLIMQANPKETDAQLDFGVRSIIGVHLLTSDATKKYGLGAMTNKRWKQLFDLAVKNRLVSKSFRYQDAYTLKFIKYMHVHLG